MAARASDAERAVVVAVDPGRRKCGVAVVGLDGRVRGREVVPSEGLGEYLEALASRWPVERLVVGDRTGGRAVEQALAERGLLERLGGVTRVDEHLSSVEGRRLYWEHHPRTGWRRWVPASMQTPPEPFDHFVAEVLARRYLAELGEAGDGNRRGL